MAGDSRVTTGEDQSLWETGDFHFKGEELEAQVDFRAWLKKLRDNPLAQHLAALRRNSPGRIFQAKEVLALERIIYRCCDVPKGRWIALSLLGKCIYHANRLGKGPIAPARLVQLLSHETSNLRYHTVEAQKTIQRWKACADEWIRELAERETPKTKKTKETEKAEKTEKTEKTVPISLVITTAVLSGHVLNVDLAIALIEACADKKKRFAFRNQRFYADLLVSWGKLQGVEQRRWYGDRRLAALIARVSSSSVKEALYEKEADEKRRDHKQTADLICRDFRARLKKMQDPAASDRHDLRRSEPKSLFEMMQVMQQALVTELPSLLVEYLSGRVSSRSLAPSSIGRIYGDPSIQPVLPHRQPALETNLLHRNQDDEPIGENLEFASGELEHDEEEPAWLLFLRRCFRGSDKAFEVRRQLVHYTKETQSHEPPLAAGSEQQASGCAPPFGQLIVNFAQHLLRYESSSGRKWKVATVKGCVLTVARRLGLLVGDDELETLETIQLENLYLEALEIAGYESQEPRSLQRSVAWALKEFNRFLNPFRNGKPPVSEAAIFDVYCGLTPVDARIISLDDCFRILDLIAQVKEERVRNIAILEVIFGFGGSLRRMEGFGLRKQDWAADTFWSPLLIEEWQMRRLKTPNARRWVPLEPLLPLAAREGLAREDATQYLFGEGIEGESLRNKVIRVIHSAMIEATGDESMHYHLLRHSFCTWMMLRLFAGQHRELAEVFRHLPRTYEWLKGSDLRRQLGTSELVASDDVWMVAVLAGHGSPATSLEHYCHCLDLIAPFLLAKIFSADTNDEAAVAREQRKRNSDLRHAMGLSKSNVANQQKTAVAETGGKMSVEQLADKFLKYRFPARKKETKPKAAAPRHWIESTYSFIWALGTTGQDVFEIAPLAGVGPELAETVAGTSKSLFSINERRPQPAFRDTHRTLARAKLWLPKKPSGSSWAVVKRFAQRIDDQMKCHPDSTRKALLLFATTAISASRFRLEEEEQVQALKGLFQGMGLTDTKCEQTSSCGIHLMVRIRAAEDQAFCFAMGMGALYYSVTGDQKPNPVFVPEGIGSGITR